MITTYNNLIMKIRYFYEYLFCVILFKEYHGTNLCLLKTQAYNMIFVSWYLFHDIHIRLLCVVIWNLKPRFLCVVQISVATYFLLRENLLLYLKKEWMKRSDENEKNFKCDFCAGYRQCYHYQNACIWFLYCSDKCKPGQQRYLYRPCCI